MEKVNTIELTDIYKILHVEQLVVEFNIPSKTSGGIILNDKAMQELRKNMSPCMKVVMVGSKITDIKPGDYILPSNDARFQQVALLYRNSREGLQQVQMHISDVLGVVDADFARIKTVTETKEQIIN